MDHATALRLVTAPAGMSPDDVAHVIDWMLAGSAAPDRIAAVLTGWHHRGETGAEVASTVEALLARTPHRIPDAVRCMDLCGTGGSGKERFNVSTTAAFVVASAGIPVAKHGNRGSAKPNGSFDLLDALGIPFQFTPGHHAELLSTSGICFLFARQMHPAVGAVAPARKLAALQVPRTIFNLAGPLANPARPVRQIIGASDAAVATVMCDAAARLGSERVAIVRGHGGLDELTTSGANDVWEVADGRCHHRLMAQFHRPGVTEQHLAGSTAEANAATLSAILTGIEKGPLRELVVVNAGAAIDCWHGRPIAAGSEGQRLAKQLLDDGAAQQCFERHRARARALAGI